MNRYAYLATGRLVALMQGLSRVRVHIHNPEHIPKGPVVFVVNHFTRLETLLVPFHIYRLSRTPVWSLADRSFFEGAFGTLLDSVGVVSTRDPHRDRLMVKTLLTGEANWIIYPEGHMVKDKGGRRGLLGRAGSSRPHSGAAALALRAEFYRQRLMRLARSAPEEAQRLCALFDIPDLAAVGERKTRIVPVNLTYYPLRAKENVLSRLADLILDEVEPRLKEEILTEGSMLFSGVDIDMSFGLPLEVDGPLAHPLVQRDIRSRSPLDPDDRLPSLPLMRHASRLLMERYMEAIYAMTTVNHDHLFASLLRALPLSTIREDDFRRRVYLLASSVLDRGGVRCHRSLKEDQVALLTDDRYHKYRDFLLLAQEKGVLEEREGILHCDRRNFSAPFELHRARLDNPIGVIANEVSALRALQREVRRIAWLPRFVVRRRVAQRLEEEAVAEFEEDYSAFSTAKERKGREVGAPLLLRGRSRALGVVLVHGFLSAPMEVAELARHLQGEGFWVYLVRLKGHGTGPADLAQRSRLDWMASVDRGYALMRVICREVVLGGFSFGGGVALDCASRVGKVAGVFAVAPPHRLMDISSRFVPAVAAWNRIMDFVRLRGGKLEYAQIVPERPQINYSRLPVRAVWELEHFMRLLEPKLRRISVPALVVQGDRDPVVDPRGSRRLFEMLGSPEKEYRIFPRSRHGILAGEGAGEVHATITLFLRRLESRVPRGWRRR